MFEWFDLLLGLGFLYLAGLLYLMGEDDEKK